MLALPQGAPATAGIAVIAAGLRQRMPGQERRQVSGNGDRAHPRTSAAVRDGERLVQVEMTDVGANRRRARQADLRVHVRAVHVHLAAMLVDDGADVADRFLVDAVRRGIRHHQRGQIVAVRLGLRLQVRNVHVALRVGRDHNDFHPGHDRAGRIGAVRGGRDQHHVATRLAAAAVPRANDQQAGQLALRAGVRLQRDRGNPVISASACSRS